MYEVQYRRNHQEPWMRAGYELTREQAIGDFKRKYDEYQSGLRRCTMLTRTIVKFDIVIRETTQCAE